MIAMKLSCLLTLLLLLLLLLLFILLSGLVLFPGKKMSQ